MQSPTASLEKKGVQVESELILGSIGRLKNTVNPFYSYGKFLEQDKR